MLSSDSSEQELGEMQSLDFESVEFKLLSSESIELCLFLLSLRSLFGMASGSDSGVLVIGETSDCSLTGVHILSLKLMMTGCVWAGFSSRLLLARFSMVNDILAGFFAVSSPIVQYCTTVIFF